MNTQGALTTRLFRVTLSQDQRTVPFRQEDQLHIIAAILRSLAMALAFVMAIAAHECGHYVFIRAGGIPVEEVCLGEGPVLIEGHLPDGAKFRVCAYPFSGFVQANRGYLMSYPPSVPFFIGMFLAGIFSTTLLACCLYALYAALGGLEKGFWRLLWFGFRHSFLSLLLVPFQLVYGVLTFTLWEMIARSWPVRIIVPFLIDEKLVDVKSDGESIPVSPGTVSWIGMIAVAMFLISLFGIMPFGATSDISMIIRILAIEYGSRWLIDPMSLIILLNLAILALLVVFVLQLLVFLIVSIFKQSLANENNSSPGDSKHDGRD
ncbi:MAG: site-2 protease family protein [Patescibacteria group bacterium]